MQCWIQGKHGGNTRVCAHSSSPALGGRAPPDPSSFSLLPPGSDTEPLFFAVCPQGCMCLIPELAMFGWSHRCSPCGHWLHRVPSVKLLWGESPAWCWGAVAGVGCVKVCSAQQELWAPWNPGLHPLPEPGRELPGMGRGWQGCRRGTRAAVTSGIAGRQLGAWGGGRAPWVDTAHPAGWRRRCPMEPSCCPLAGSSRFLAETMGTGPQGAHSPIPSPCCSTLEQGTTGSCCCLASRLCAPGLALPSRQHRGGHVGHQG